MMKLNKFELFEYKFCCLGGYKLMSELILSPVLKRIGYQIREIP